MPEGETYVVVAQSCNANACTAEPFKRAGYKALAARAAKTVAKPPTPVGGLRGPDDRQCRVNWTRCSVGIVW